MYSNILQIEVLLRNINKITENISLGYLAEVGEKNSDEVQKQLTEHFMMPNEILPQAIIHSYCEGEEDEGN